MYTGVANGASTVANGVSSGVSTVANGVTSGVSSVANGVSNLVDGVTGNVLSKRRNSRFTMIDGQRVHVEFARVYNETTRRPTGETGQESRQKLTYIGLASPTSNYP